MRRFRRRPLAEMVKSSSSSPRSTTTSHGETCTLRSPLLTPTFSVSRPLLMRVTSMVRDVVDAVAVAVVVVVTTVPVSLVKVDARAVVESLP